MNSPDQLTDEEWAEIDATILACHPPAACWRIRELAGVEPEEAREIRHERIHQLRDGRSGDFAWSGYPCEDYLESGWADTGCWDEPSRWMLIVPAGEVSEAHGLLVVGGPGVDGITFGYRKGYPGLWAYKPWEEGYTRMAATVADLVEKWTSGELGV